MKPPAESGELMPMQVGSFWVYQAWRPDPPETLKAEITRKVSVSIDGVTYEASAYLLPYPVNGPRPPFEWLYWNGPDGLYWLGGISKTDTLLYKALLFKYPVQGGESWNVIRINYDDANQRFYFFDTLAVSLVSKDEPIETPAGEFKCYVYKYSKRSAFDVYENWDYYHYFTPGIGRAAYIQINSITGRPLDRLYLMEYSKMD